jgi:hypothetical protein
MPSATQKLKSTEVAEKESMAERALKMQYLGAHHRGCGRWQS